MCTVEVTSSIQKQLLFIWFELYSNPRQIRVRIQLAADTRVLETHFYGYTLIPAVVFPSRMTKHVKVV